MELSQIETLLHRIHGCTFASLDTETKPSAGIRKVTTGERVIVFTNVGGSGYERMVKRRLAEIGKDPATFRVSDLPWGERVPGTPLIYHRGEHYLQTILLSPGEIETFIGARKVNPSDMPWLFKGGNDNQGLPLERQVVVRTYALKSIKRLSIMGEEVFAPETNHARVA